MRLSRLRVHGFGALHDLVFDLCPGVNLFVGENESGKSTLQQALLAALYGFHEHHEGRGRRLAGGGDAEARYQPWDTGGKYATSVEYELDGGRKLRIERRFATNNSDLQVHDVGGGEQIIVPADRYGGLPPALQQQYLGSGRAVFTSSACVDQGKLATLADSASLSEALVKALDSNEADVSAREALRLLDDAKDKGVGGPKAHTKPLRGARDELARAQGDLAEWDRKRNAVDADMRKEAALIADLEPRRAAIARLTLAKARRELADVEALLQRLDQAERRLQVARAGRDELGGYSGFRGARPEDAATALARLRQARRRADELAKRQAEEASRVAALRERLAEQEGVVAGLRHLEAFPSGRQDEVRRLHTEWIAARERLAALREQPPVLAEMQPGARRGFSLPIFALGALAAVVLAVAGVALDAALPGAVAAAVVLAIAAVVATRVKLAPRVAEPRYIAPDTTAAEAAEREARGCLDSVLAEAGITGEQPDQAVRRFDALVNDRQRWQEAEREIDRTRQELAALAGHDTELLGATEEQQQARQRFADLMAAAGIVCDDPEAAYRQHEEKREGLARLQEAEARVAAAERERDAVLAGKTAAAVEEERAECAGRLLALAGSAMAAAAVEVPAEAPAAIEARIADETASLHEAEIRLAELRTNIAQGLPAGASRGEIEERIAHWQQEVAKLERFGRALDLATEHLREATREAREDFVPRLNAAMAGTVGTITAGRYDDILVAFPHDDMPHITLSGPGTPQRVDVSRLSLGTIEQCYIALRLAIAGLLSEGGERLPVILDDPFVNYDRTRLERMLAFLVDLSQQHQVLLFSKDEALPAWFEAHVPDPEALRVFRMRATER